VSDVGFDVRQMVSGQRDPWGLFQRCKVDSLQAHRIGRSVGMMLGEQHTKIYEADVTGWIPQRVAWPEPGDWIRERLPRVVADSVLVGMMGRVIERYETVTVDAKDRSSARRRRVA
jgi:hypothetical protein